MSSAALEGVYQSSVSGDGYGQVYNPSSTGDPVSASYSQSFTGMDGAGNTQTMTFNGTATSSAVYGQLHSDASGTVTIPYYNANNPAFIVSSIGNNPAELFYTDQTGNLSMDWATMDYAINGNSPQTITIQFDSSFSMSTQNYPDGSTVSGEANFSDTLTLAGIEIVDANGNPVSGVTVTSASGTSYDVVPEPTAVTCLLLAAAVLLIVVRRRGGGVTLKR